MDAQELYRQGKLDEAIQAMNEEVRADPADPDKRSLLSDLLCIVGNYDRADLQLDAIGKVLPGAVAAIGLTRQLVRAEQWRQQCFAEGRVPEFVDKPGEREKLYLQAMLLVREGSLEEAAGVIQQVEELRAPLSGTSNGTAFDDFRDCDDLTAGVFEVLTSTGKYFWIPMGHVERIEFRPIERPRDLLWRRVGMDVRGGPDGEVFIPAIYAPTPEDNPARMGRTTEWSETEPVRGVGLRSFLVGDELATLTELTELSFTPDEA
jgi:type VI secretion system protein ImpE